MANYNVSYKIDATGNLVQVNQTAASINKNMKEAAVSAGALGKAASGALAATARRPAMEERDYERARGVTGLTGASGRDFAKQAEGLGGLVRVYATFAANIFAVTQAFEILKRSFSFEQLQKASDTFAVTTGKNLSGIAKELRMLSDGALTAKAAQQFANYGQSAGFTADQLRRLVGVARGASQALGRDFSDAIDRLIRGTGKLEPELLDEIGILTRTKTAGEAYAKTLGKTFEQLTQFEKVQAFTNAVIEEGERKFGAVAKAVPVSAFEKFAAAAIDAGTGLANFVNKGLVPLLNVLSNNPGLIIAGIIAAVAKLASTALPLLTNLSAKAKASAAEQADIIKQKQADATKASETAAMRRIAAIDAEKAAFIAAEEAKTKAMNKRVSSNLESRGLTPNAPNAPKLFSALATVNVGEYTKLQEIQKNITKEIKTQTTWIKNYNAGVHEANAANKASLITRTQTLNVLYKEQDTVNGLLKSQAEYNRLIQQEGAVRKANAVQFNTSQRAEFAGKKKDLFADVVNVAGQKMKGNILGPFSEAFKTLSIQSAILGKEATTAGGKLDWLAGKFPALTGGLQKAATASIFFSGAVRVIGVAAVGLINGLLPIIGIVTALYFAFDMIIGALGGYSDKIDAAKESSETLSKSNKMAVEQAVEYNQVLKENTGSLTDWAKTAEYSANAISGISDNLSKASKDMLEFQMSTGAVSKAWQSVLSVFDADLASKFTKSFKNSIVSTMSLSTGEDKAKIQKAILDLFPDAKTMDQAFTQFEKLNDVQKAFKANEVSSAIEKTNQALKANAANLKAASDGWIKVGEALDEYNKKEEVKDPKLKGIVDALKSIEVAYAAAATEADKIKVLSGITEEQQQGLNKLLKERNIDGAAYNKLLDDARTKNKELLAIQEQQRQEHEKTALAAANMAINVTKGYDFSATQDIKDAAVAYEELKQKLRETKIVSPEQATELKVQLSKTSADYIIELEKLAAKSDSLTREGLLLMIKAVREEAPKVGEEFSSSIAAGINKGLEALSPEKLIAIRESYRKMEASAYGSDRGAAATPAQIAKAQEDNRQKELKALRQSLSTSDKITSQKAVMSKAYELDVKLAQAQLEIIKQIAAIQQQAVGYVSSRVAGEQLAAQLKIIELQRVKEIAEIERDDAKRRKDKAEYNRSQRELDEASRTLANEAAARAKEAATLENLRLTLTREKVRYEKEYLDFVKMGLELESQILDAAVAINRVDQLQASTIQADIAYRKEVLAINQKTFELAQREALLNAGRGRDGETAATIAAERKLIEFTKQRAEITKQLAVEQAKYNEYVNNVKADLESVTENLSQQLNFTVELSSATARQQQALDQINLLASNIVIEFEKLPKAQQNSIQLENMLLDAANKVLETKRQIYELNSRSGSNADFTETVKQGLELASLDFAKTSKSLARTTVDAMTGAIDAVVDDLFAKIKSGAKVTIGDLLKVGTDFVRNALLDFVSQEIKGFLRNSLAGLFGGMSPEEQQKQAINDLKAKIVEASKTHDKNTASIKDLIKGLVENTNAINANTNSKSQTTAGGDPLSGFVTPGGANGFFNSLITGSNNAGDASSELADNLLDLANKPLDIFGKSNLFAADSTVLFSEAVGTATQAISSMASSIGSGGGGGIGSLLSGIGSIFGGGAGIKGLFANLFGGSASELAPGFVGPPSPGTSAGVGAFEGIMGGASTGAAVGGLAASLFGNERNQKGMQIGGTIGGIAGSFFGPIGSLIGSALGSALGSLWKSGGGPKSGGFAQSGKGFDRFYTPSDKDSDLTESVKNLSSTYDTLISKLGGSGKANFGLGFDADPKGTANSRVTAGVIVNGKEIKTTTEAGRSPEQLAAELESASSRLLLTAIKNSELPENVANYFGGITDDVIKTLSKEDVEKKLDFSSILGSIAKSRDKIAELFGEDLYNLTEEQLQPFNKQGELLSETFKRLGTEFAVTNRVVKYLGVSIKSAFGAVGLASADMREKLIDGAGGLEAFTEQFNYFLENFFTEIEVAGIEFASAGEALRNGFAGLSITIPQTMAGYKQAVTDALAAGNIELYNSLMELAPAFNNVVGAIERVNASIAGMASNFLDEIAAGTQTAEQRFNTFRGRANDAQAEIDEIMQMTPEALIQAVQAGTITPAQIEALASSAIENAQSAWNLLDENQKKILGPEFTRFTTNLTTNVSAVLEAINAAILAGPKPDPGKVPDATTSSTVTPPTTEELLAVPDKVGTAIVDSLTSGAKVVKTSIMDAFSSVKLFDAPEGLGAGPLGTTPEQIEAQRYREEAAALAQTALQEQQRVTQENHAAALAAMAEKVLGAANGMLEAAAHMQAAATTPQQVTVTVQTLDDNVAAEVGV